MKGISIKEVSVKTGINRDTIARMERGVGNPSFSKVVLVVKALGLRIEILI